MCVSVRVCMHADVCEILWGLRSEPLLNVAFCCERGQAHPVCIGLDPLLVSVSVYVYMCLCPLLLDTYDRQSGSPVKVREATVG